MIFHHVEHLLQVSWVVQAALAASVLLLLAGVAVRRRLADPSLGVLPDEGVSLRNVAEVMVEWLAGLARERIGPEYRRYFPIVGTMFFFILISNLMGLIPGLDGATTDGNTTWAWAIIAWVTYTAVGIQKHRMKYVLKFMGPSFFHWKVGGRTFHVRPLAIVFLPLELVLDLARMLTLAVRLMANMFADHTVIGVWLVLVPIGVPAIFMGLGIIISLLQAFIFALLTMIYIGLALEEPH
jgi:F-type H+-transporting ATPase subunit a